MAAWRMGNGRFTELTNAPFRTTAPRTSAAIFLDVVRRNPRRAMVNTMLNAAMPASSERTPLVR